MLRLVAGADALIEGFRPGVMERLGLGPDVCLARNPRLVYGRMTGWGQDGPLAQAAGHDINYIALAGALEGIGREGEPPLPPLNLVGDFGGGGMLLAFGVLAGLLEHEALRQGPGRRRGDGRRRGAAHVHVLGHAARWACGASSAARTCSTPARTSTRCTRAADGKYVSLGSIEPQFYAELVKLGGLDAEEFPQLDRARWPELKQRLAAVFKRKTRDEWCAIMEGSDVCFAPVLAMGEAPSHPHNVARKTFIDVAGVTQPAPAPRFSRTAPAVRAPPAKTGRARRRACSRASASAPTRSAGCARARRSPDGSAAGSTPRRHLAGLQCELRMWREVNEPASADPPSSRAAAPSARPARAPARSCAPWPPSCSRARLAPTPTRRAPRAAGGSRRHRRARGRVRRRPRTRARGLPGARSERLGAAPGRRRAAPERDPARRARFRALRRAPRRDRGRFGGAAAPRSRLRARRGAARRARAPATHGCDARGGPTLARPRGAGSRAGGGARRRRAARVEPSPHCRRPEACAFLARCTERLPADWVGHLPGLRPQHLRGAARGGVARIGEVPADFQLTPAQRNATRASRAGRRSCAAELASALDRSPRAPDFLDFEAIMPEVPVYRRHARLRAGALPVVGAPARRGRGARHAEFLADGAAPIRGAASPRAWWPRSPGGGCRSPSTRASRPRSWRRRRASSRTWRPASTRLRARLFDLLPVLRRLVYHPASRARSR